jgi:hypothetical protein
MVVDEDPEVVVLDLLVQDRRAGQAASQRSKTWANLDLYCAGLPSLWLSLYLRQH